MKAMLLKRIVPAVLALLLVLLPIHGLADGGEAASVQNLLAHICGELSAQAWLDQNVAANAGSSADNYVITLNHFEHELDLSAYIAAAAQKVQPGGITNPVSRMRCALALVSCGAGDQIPADLADACIGKLGVMSYVYGLHLLNNGVESALWTREAIAEKLLSMQKEDGGWAVKGEFSDVDVTAMCLQALCLCVDLEGVNAALDRGVALLSARQLDSGGFTSTGRENSESSCQVLTAFSGLGIDPHTDAGFVKNGNSVYDALMAYRLPGGGFSHLPGEAENETANIQALQALTALQQQGIPYFDLSSKKISVPLIPEGKATLPLPVWKLIALGVIGVFLVIGCVFALTRSRGRGKQLLFVFAAAAIAAALVFAINIESAADYYSADAPEAADGQVYLTVRCDTVAGRATDGSTPKSGVILARSVIPFAKGDSVFDILTEAARRHQLHLEHQGGSGDLAYINAINYLYEYAYGELSGWIYTVNGEQLSVGCGACEVQDGDEIIWQYTLDLGEDVK